MTKQRDIAQRSVLLLDPMLATGGTVTQAIEVHFISLSLFFFFLTLFKVLVQRGVPQEKIVFVNLIAAPEGIEVVFDRYPGVTIVTSEIGNYSIYHL